MSLTFSTQFEKGSYIDAVSKTVMTPTNLSLKKTKRGLALDFFPQTARYITTAVPSSAAVGNNCAIEAWVKTGDVSGTAKYIAMTCRAAGSTYMSILVTGGTLRGYFADNAARVNTGTITTPITQNTDYHILFVRENTSTLKLYVNDVLVGSASTGGQSPSTDPIHIGSIQSSLISFYDGTIYKVRTYNHVPTQIEMDNMFKEYQRSFTPTEQKRNFDYPKPTDLNRETGLVAAYSFHKDTVGGGVVRDISGNGYNGTFVGRPILTKDGLNFNGTTDYINGTSVLQTESSSLTKTLVARFRHNTGTTTVNERVGIQLSKATNSTAFGFFFRGPTNKNIALIYGTPTTTESLDSGVVMSKEETTVVGVQNGSNISIYVNGVLTATANNAGVATYSSPVNFVIGVSPLKNVDFANSNLLDCRFYNYAFTPAQALAYHNSFKKPTLIETFKDAPAGEILPEGWVKGTGSYVVGEVSVTPANIITNGNFSSTSGWSALRATIAVSNNILSVTQTDPSTAGYAFYTPGVTLTVGKKYRLTATRIGKVGSTNVTLFDSSFTQSYPISFSSTSDETKSVEFTASYTSHTLRLASILPVGDVASYANVSITEIPPLPTIDNGTKYLQNATAGILAIPSKQAYGTWEFDLYKVNPTGIAYAVLTSTEKTLSATVTGYSVGLDSSNRVFFGRANTSTFLNNVLARTAANYINVNTWYRLRLTRSATGLFTLFIRGGIYTDWTLVSTAGGSGNNPVTDTVYTTSSYMLTGLGVGDRIANIKLYNQ